MKENFFQKSNLGNLIKMSILEVRKIFKLWELKVLWASGQNLRALPNR